MFTLEQISQAHARVRSGADFPTYIKELKTLGIIFYTSHVKDGHTDFKGVSGDQLSSPVKYATLQIGYTADIAAFRKNLLEHQQGKTSYPEFCVLAAENGIDCWEVDLEKMTCTYRDLQKKEVLVEQIPKR